MPTRPRDLTLPGQPPICGSIGTLRKEILWDSETATDAEVRAKEMQLIRETGANDPAIGHNRSPHHRADPMLARSARPGWECA
jgi:hypothetical protein